jgi:ABC-type amino acid transport substrate-binding protein
LLRSLVILAALLVSGFVQEEEPDFPLVPAEEAAPLRVGIASHPPFARKEEDGSWQGLSVNLWRSAAESLGADYRFVETDRADLVRQLASGELDAALPVIADAESARMVDFVFPHYTSTLGIAEKRRGRIINTVKRLLSLDFLKIVLSLSALLFVVGAIVWVLERRGNEDQFSRRPLKGLGDGFWWAGVTLTTIGYGDKAPATVAGRAVAMIWMLVGLAVSAALTAAVVSAMDMSRDSSSFDDLEGKNVGALQQDGAMRYLEAQGFSPRTFEDVTAGIRAVDKGELDAFVHAGPPLRAAIDGDNFDLTISVTDEDPQPVTIAVQSGSDLAADLEPVVIGRTTSPGWWEQVEKWIPDQNKKP